MSRFLTILFTPLFLLCLVLPAEASVQLAPAGQPPVTIDEVYLSDGVPFLAIDDVLPALGLSGDWDSVAHVYRLRTPRGTAVISPGSDYLRLGERFIPLTRRPRFIDGRLRVAEDFVTVQLPALLDRPVSYRNLNPPAVAATGKDTPLDKLFAFLLRKKRPGAGGPALRGLAIDPGHGGQDTGVLAADGTKEKDVVLAVAEDLEKQTKMHLGIPVYLSRDADYGLSRKKRFEAAAKPDVDALLLLHAQASLSPLPQGISLIVRPPEFFDGGTPPAGEAESMRLARFLRAALVEAGLQVNDIVEAPLLPLGRGDLPSVVIELGYLSNPSDRSLLLDPQGRQRLAGALFRGLRNYSSEEKNP